jgi:hypothetical protein
MNGLDLGGMINLIGKEMLKKFGGDKKSFSACYNRLGENSRKQTMIFTGVGDHRGHTNLPIIAICPDMRTSLTLTMVFVQLTMQGMTF